MIKRKVKKTTVAEEIKDSSSTSTDAVRPSALTRRKLNQKNCNIIVFILLLLLLFAAASSWVKKAVLVALLVLMFLILRGALRALRSTV